MYQVDDGFSFSHSVLFYFYVSRQKGSPSLNFNSKDGKVNRRSYIGDYGCVDGVPRYAGRQTGIQG